MRTDSPPLIPTTITEYFNHLWPFPGADLSFGYNNHPHMPELVRRERPRHVVCIQPFQIALWPVSQGIWQQYIGFCTGCDNSGNPVCDASRPVTNVSWEDIVLSKDHPSFIKWCKQVTGIDWQLPHEYELEHFAKTYRLHGPEQPQRADATVQIPPPYRREWCSNNFGSFPLCYPNDLLAGTEKSIRVVNAYRSTNLMDRTQTRLHAHTNYASDDLGFRLLVRGRSVSI